MKRCILFVKSENPLFIASKFFGGIVTSHFLILEPSIIPGYTTAFIRGKNARMKKKPSVLNTLANVYGYPCTIIPDGLDKYSNLEVIWESLEMTEERWVRFAQKCLDGIRIEELDYTRQKEVEKLKEKLYGPPKADIG